LQNPGTDAVTINVASCCVWRDVRICSAKLCLLQMPQDHRCACGYDETMRVGDATQADSVPTSVLTGAEPGKTFHVLSKAHLKSLVFNLKSFAIQIG